MRDLWFACMEELLDELLDQGVSFDEAYERAATLTDGRVIDRLGDMADYERMRRKEGL